MILDKNHLISWLIQTEKKKNFLLSTNKAKIDFLQYQPIDAYACGLESLKKNGYIPLNNEIIDFIIKKILNNINVILGYFFSKNIINIPQVNDFLLEMSREIIYCKINNLPYGKNEIYLRSLTTLSESTLQNHKCPDCNANIVSNRISCTDLKCPVCNLNIEVKLKNMFVKKNSNIVIQSGLPEGVTNWKNNQGKLILCTKKGYYITSSSEVMIKGYIKDLPLDWGTNSKYFINTKRKTKMIVNESKLKKFNLDINFKWSFYTLYISRFLDLFYNFIKMDQDISRVNHYLPIRNAIWTFEENIFENNDSNDDDNLDNNFKIDFINNSNIIENQNNSRLKLNKYFEDKDTLINI